MRARRCLIISAMALTVAGGGPIGVSWAEWPAGHPAASAQELQWVTGEVASVDVTQGSLTLGEPRMERAREPDVQFKVAPMETNVTDASDQEFLQLEDLRPGQTVQVGYRLEGGRRAAKAITVLNPSASALEPWPAATTIQPLQWISGEVILVDLPLGIVTVEENRTGSPNELRHYLIRPGETVVLDELSQQSLAFRSLRPGHRVRIGFLAEGDLRRAKTIIVSSPPAELP